MAAGSTYTPITTTTLTSNATTVDFTSISSSYTDIIISIQAKWTGTGSSSFCMRFNADGNTNYSHTQMYGTGTSASSNRNSNEAQMPIGQITSTGWNSTRFHVMNYANSTTYKTSFSKTDTDSITLSGVGLWRSTSAINQITLGYFDGGVGQFASGSTFTLYGITAA